MHAHTRRTPLPRGSHSAGRDKEILAFGRSWYRYGGGPAEDIMVTFGLTENQFFTEIRHLLAAHEQFDLSPSEITAMDRVARYRLDFC